MSEEIREKVSVLVDKINRMSTKEQVAATALIDGLSIGMAIGKEEQKAAMKEQKTSTN